jgi:hypothetical protein
VVESVGGINRQIGNTDVSSRYTPIQIVLRVYFSEIIRDSALSRDGYSEIGECGGSVNNTIICFPIVVLDLLKEHDIRVGKEICDMICDSRKVRRFGVHVINLWICQHCPTTMMEKTDADIVISDCDCAGVIARSEASGRYIGDRRGQDCWCSKRENIVKAESASDE